MNQGIEGQDGTRDMLNRPAKFEVTFDETKD
jgi:hypothetical protein